MQQQQQQKTHQPRLYHNLKVALASLYGLPLEDSTPRPSPHQAHEFLLHVQSRNARRKIQSVYQRRRDHEANIVKGKVAEQQQQQSAAIEMGSSWLASIYLLLLDDANSTTTEKLFCAQTLLHRLRRAKMAEAIDWEVERPNDIADPQECWHFHVDPTQMAAQYKEWMRLQNALLGAVLDTVTIQPNAPQANSQPGVEFSALEDQYKGEMSLLTLSSILFLTLLKHQNNNHGTDNNQDDSLPPLATTLGGVIAMVALRLRYSTVNAHQAEQHPQHEQQSSLVLMVAHSLQAVWTTLQQQNDNHHSGDSLRYQQALELSLDACLGAIPDTILGSPGGARGRLSMDPKCIQAATAELRTRGLVDLWSILGQRQEAHLSSIGILTICLQWAKYLPMPLDFVQNTGPLINACLGQEGSRQEQLALAYLIAILEGGAWSLDEVLAYNLGLSEQQLVQQATKKKQTSRSKKRQKGHIDARSSDAVVEAAIQEVQMRGQVACVANSLVWDRLLMVAHRDLHALAADSSSQVAGEGAIGCLTASANACLPHIVRNPTANTGDLFMTISKPFQEICKSTNKSVRGIAMEALYSLHSAVLEVIREKGSLDGHLEDLIVHHFYECCMGLAASCGYPMGYFEHLCADSDEELEVERNDVRDLMRCLTGSEESKQSSEQIKEPFHFSLCVLSKLVKACNESILAAQAQNLFCGESVIHAFSSLAKSLNQVASFLKADEQSQASAELVDTVLSTVSLIMDNVNTGFLNETPINEFLPVCRIAVITASSISPFLAIFCEGRWQASVADCVHKSVKVAARSVETIPELLGQSSLGRTMFDIRGTMRGPGGEDHVGCLALMRLVFESDSLAALTAQSSDDFMKRMCTIHEYLKRIEIERGAGIWHGRGVAPKSRRILLNILCHLEVLSGGSLGASQVLTDLFLAAVRVPLTLKERSPYDANVFFDMTEAVLDINSFTPGIVVSLFSGGDDPASKERRACLETLTAACIEGYKNLVVGGEPNSALKEWNRLRYALFYLMKMTGTPDILPMVAEMISAFVKAECEAVCNQCAAGPESLSSLFCDEIVSPDMIPAGVHLRTISEVIRSQSKHGLDLKSVPNCLHLLVVLKDFVFPTIMLDCPDPLFVDPRPNIMEVWLLVLVDVIRLLPKGESIDSNLLQLLNETVLTLVIVLFNPRLSRTPTERDPGMSFDGPNSLAITEFFTAYFGLGPAALEAATDLLFAQIPSDFGPAVESHDPRVLGVAILSAALFRGVQGSLPPWTVEAVPEVYSAFYFALGKNADAFCRILSLSMDVKLKENASPLGGIKPGYLLSGRYFVGLNPATKAKFISDIHELAVKDDLTSWRRAKVLIKQICGGKKKDNRQQKPPPTRWDFDRL